MQMRPFRDVEEAIRYVLSFSGPADEFRLPIDDSLQDPIGLNMALIADKILARGWEPDGYEQKNGYRVYRYKEAA